MQYYITWLNPLQTTRLFSETVHIPCSPQAKKMFVLARFLLWLSFVGAAKISGNLVTNLVSGRIPSAQDFAISLPQHLSEVWTRRSNNYRALSDKCKAQCHFVNVSDLNLFPEFNIHVSFFGWPGVDTFKEVIRTYLLFGTATFFRVQFKTPWWCMVSWLDFYHLSWPIIQRPRHGDKAFWQTICDTIYTSNNDFQHQLGAGISEKQHKASYSTKLKIVWVAAFRIDLRPTLVKENHRFFLAENPAGARAQIFKRCPYRESRISKNLQSPVILVSSTPFQATHTLYFACLLYLYIYYIYTHIVIKHTTCKMN